MTDLDEFVHLHYAELLRFAYLLAGSAPTAEDLVQTALLKAMRRWGSIDDPYPYVRRIIANVHVSRWRRHRAREQLTPFVPDEGRPDPTDRIAQREALLAALRDLPPRTRAVIVMRYWADMSEVDTATALGCSIGTVKSAASRGLARLRGSLDTVFERGSR